MLPSISDITQANTARMKIRARSRTPPGGRRTNDSTFCFNPDASDAEGNSGDDVPMAKYPYLFIAEKTIRSCMWECHGQVRIRCKRQEFVIHCAWIAGCSLPLYIEEARSTETRLLCLYTYTQTLDTTDDRFFCRHYTAWLTRMSFLYVKQTPSWTLVGFELTE